MSKMAISIWRERRPLAIVLVVLGHLVGGRWGERGAVELITKAGGAR